MAVTGTKASGSDFVGINDALKQTYSGPFATNIEGEQEVLSAFQAEGDFETTEGSDGKQINLGQYISAGGGVSAMLEDDYLPDNVAAFWLQTNLTIKQIAARLDLSGRVFRRAIAGPAAFATWADMALTEKAKRVAFHMDRMALGTGKGIVAQINGTPTGTGDAVNNAYGISGLEGAINLFLRDDTFRYSPNANGSSPRTGVVHVVSLNYGAATFNTDLVGALGTPATAASAASGDYVFLGSANVNGSGAREITGLEAHLDDGTNVSTYQGVTRSTYSDVLYSQIINSTTSYGGVLSEDLLDYADTLAYERAGGKPDLVLMNRNGLRSFWKTMKGDRTLPDPQGNFVGGKRRLSVFLGDREVELRGARKVPSSRVYGIDRSSFRRFKIGAGAWDDRTGAIWKQVQDSTGVKDAAYAIWIQEEELACVHPARNFKITTLSAA